MEQIGRYQLVRRLAVGGMAEVFLARAEGPKGFEKQLVIKRILAHLAEQPKFVQLFLSEARIAARLSHPNIASVFDLGEADGVPYLAMEYVDGPSLRGLLQRAQTLGRGLPVVLCARIASLAADGLAYAHEFCDPESGEWLGLIHRDVSPENVLVSMNGSVKVVDFGIAKAAGLEPSKSASLRGKYSYMAPEQLRGKQRLDRRVDVFALGVTLYELLTGKKPFEARGELEMMRAILFSEHMPASRRRPEIPEALDAILARALGKDRDARYPTCREFQADLEEFIRGTGEDVSAYRIARLVQSLDAIPRTPTGSHFPAQLPGVINTRTSPTRMAELAALGTRIGAQPAPVPEAQTPSSAGATRHLAASAAMLTPETRILPLDAVSPIDLTGTRTEVGPAARTWAPLLVGAALLTAGGGLMAYRFVDGVRESRRQTRLERAEARAVVHEEPTSLPMIERVVLPAQVTLRTSVPSELWIDGKKAGASPLRLEQVNPGPMTIEARGAHGAFRKTLTLAVMPGENGTREIEIARLPVDFHIPAGSRVWLDGLELGKTPLPPVHVYEGPHQIRVVLERLGRTLDTTIVVSPERANVFTFDLETTPD